MAKRMFVMVAALVMGAGALLGCDGGASRAQKSESGVTTVVVSNHVIHTGMKRFGVNLGGENYYDSGQILRDLTFANPGFEGETWQSILRCKTVTAASCVDANQYTQWPAGFLDGASFEFLSGPAAGKTGKVTGSTAAVWNEQDHGFGITFSPLNVSPAANDFVLVKKVIPGDADKGWWTNTGGGASFATEFSDLAANSPGKQALKILAKEPGQSAAVHFYFDSLKGHSFVRLKGKYRISFRAKGLGGKNSLAVGLRRLTEPTSEEFFSHMVELTPKWHDYSFDLSANEDTSSLGVVDLSFGFDETEALLDDVSLTPASSSAENPTAFRDDVVETLKELHPGILRYQDGDHLGSTMDNLIAPVFARERAGWSEQAKEQTAVPIGLPEFLQLCHVVGAEPWFNLPATTSAQEMKELMEYLGGPASGGYGAKRAARGQAAPWTTVFPMIHLELGNEEWNGTTFAGVAMPDPVAFGQRAKVIYSAGRSSPYYVPGKFDFVLGSFALQPEWTKQEMASSGGYDSASVAPYLFNTLEDASSDEAIFGPMFAEPEMVDSRPTGYMAQQLKAVQDSGHSTSLNVYEVNLSTTSGAEVQSSVDLTVPSIGAGLALIDHMLLMARDLGITTQSIWELPGYFNGFSNTWNHKQEKTPLFGIVVDIDGTTNLRRPQFLAAELANRAITANMIETKITGTNPTWDQALSANDNIKLDGAHALQTFGFAEGTKRSLILLNLSRDSSLPVAFAGDSAPVGEIAFEQMRADKITDNNETSEQVKTAAFKLKVARGGTITLQPFSMTVMTWDTAAGK